MSKPIKFFLVLLASISFNLSAMGYALQFADAPKTVRLHWKKGKIPISLSTSLKTQSSNIMPQSDIEGAIHRSLDTWEKAADIKFETFWTDKQSLSPAGNSGDGINVITIAQTPENLAVFGNDTGELSAQTRTFYNRKGFITEADIVLNPYQQFSTDGTIGTYDLEATLTHEIGHLLGLEHSTVLGATMQARQGKNGFYNLAGFAPRTLAEDDIAGIRAIYGAEISDEECCGAVVGKITQNKGKSARTFQVWMESVDSGRVFAGTETNPDGTFRLEGLEPGNYRFYNQDESKVGSAEELGVFEITKGKTTTITKRTAGTDKNFSVLYAGFNGQISNLAVPVNSGKSYLVYIGGKNLDTADLTVGCNSPYIKIAQGSIAKHDYGNNLSVLSFEVNVESETPNGEYSLFAQSPDGSKQFLVGALTIENFVNSWNSYVLSSSKQD